MKSNRGRKPGLCFMLLAILMFGLFVYLVRTYTRESLRSAEQEESELAHTYRYHYELIMDSRNETFWQEVYKKTTEVAAQNDALVTVKKAGWFEDYDKLDYLDMCIAAHVDGIILENNGEEGLEEKIDEAAEEGIPVVSIVNDIPKANRQSFVGVNDYQLGQTYGALVSELLTDRTEEILLLSNREQNLGKNQMYEQVFHAVADHVESDSRIRVREYNLRSKSQFDVEEAIRGIFQDEDGIPQILICLDEVTTECAYQVMIDLNKVGEVAIVGYSTSELTKDALERGLIPVTVCMDTEQIGAYSVEALTEYQQIGRSNTYYTVDLNCVRSKNWSREQEESHE